MKQFFIVVLTVLAGMSADARTIPVASLPELETALKGAAPGDEIVLKNGIYTAAALLNIRAAGTEKAPIVLRAESPGGAEISGSGGFVLEKGAAYITIRDFTFTHAASKARSAAGSRFCRWTNNTFVTPSDGENLAIYADDTEVDHNTFRDKNAMGRFLAIRGTGSQIAQRLLIHHNYFKSHKDQGGPNGAEAFQFGLSGFSLSASNSVVEYNLFEDCAGENELISVKASAVTLRYNTIRDCPAQFTLRHGNNCLVYGNYFIHTPGLRIFGDDHLICSNYFEDCNPAINIGNGDGEVADGDKLTVHDRPDRVLIAYNTLVNNKTNLTQSGRKEGMGATKITVAYNLIQGGGPAAQISGPNKDAVWEGNLLFATAGPGDLPAGAYRIADPKLKKDNSGAFHLQKGSPAIDAGKELAPGLTDMDGQTRKAPYDAGADEWSGAPAAAHILSPSEVGARK